MTPEFDNSTKEKPTFKINKPYKFVVHEDRGAYEEYKIGDPLSIQHIEIAKRFNIAENVNLIDGTFIADGAGWLVFDGKTIKYNLLSTGNCNGNLDHINITRRLKKLTGMKVKYTRDKLSL